MYMTLTKKSQPIKFFQDNEIKKMFEGLQGKDRTERYESLFDENKSTKEDKEAIAKCEDSMSK